MENNNNNLIESKNNYLIEKNNNYSIDEELINDIECKHNNKKKPYIKFCLSCEKNICNWCKGHENHQIIDFDSIEPDQEKF